MELNGSIAHNLRSAIKSATRLRGRRVHSDTFQFWQDLLTCARQEQSRPSTGGGWMVDGLIETLETELAERPERPIIQ
jgi:hypothetical protein